MRACAALLAAVTLAVSTDACRQPTQLTLVITSPTVTCGDLKGVLISVAGSREEAERRAGGDFVTASATCADPASHDVGTLVVTPGSSGTAAVIVVVGITTDARNCKEATKYKGCVVSRRSIAFLDHVSGTVPVVIEPECIDVPCDIATTCKRGSCITSDFDCTDDGSCVSRDPRGRDDGGPGPAEGGSDGSSDGALPDSFLPDAPPGDAADASQPPVPPFTGCRLMCLGPPPATTCLSGSFCCHVAGGPGGGPSPMTECRSEQECLAPVVAFRAGFLACCRGNLDCPKMGEVCCLTPTTVRPEPNGYAVCRPAVECVAPSVTSCGGPIDCINPGETCLPYPSPSPYGSAISACR